MREVILSIEKREKGTTASSHPPSPAPQQKKDTIQLDAEKKKSPTRIEVGHAVEQQAQLGEDDSVDKTAWADALFGDDSDTTEDEDSDKSDDDAWSDMT